MSSRRLSPKHPNCPAVGRELQVRSFSGVLKLRIVG